MSVQSDGWDYEVRQVPEGDARKIVTLEQDGMIWVGIRAFTGTALGLIDLEVTQAITMLNRAEGAYHAAMKKYQEQGK